MPSWPSPVPAVSVALLVEGRILLVKRARPPAKGLYAFPGGRVETGETLENAARREVLEETGLSLSGLREVERLDIAAEGSAGQAFTLTVFAASGASGELAAADDAESAGFFTLEQLDDLPLTDGTRRIAQKLFQAPYVGH